MVAASLTQGGRFASVRPDGNIYKDDLQTDNHPGTVLETNKGLSLDRLTVRNHF
jgi:hypothetical protein